MSDGTREARVAAQWWADRLADREAEGSVGAAMSDALASYARSKQTPPTAEQVETFRALLERALLDGPIADQSWRDAVESGEPRRGSALRSFGVDYGPDPILADALEAAGLTGRGVSLLLPLKTVMWINPGSVSVGLGYNAPPEELDLT